MTKTTQPCSFVMLGETHEELTTGKTETQDNMRLLLSVYDSLNSLSKALNKMDYYQNSLCRNLSTLERIVREI